MTSIAIELRGIRKIFGDTVANESVSLKVEQGTIHAIVGENGAGKSTAMKVLYGQYQPDGGEILIRGKPQQWRNSADAIAAGFGMVHQHFLQIGSFTVAENIVPGTPARNMATLDMRQAELQINELGQRFGLQVDPRARIEDLPMAMRQKVEKIGRAHV